ncbi:zinc-binding alcohol dehydrogenase family protein [Poritiphilus flavus]|uniref:Alcohol dehydrogenase catalytic domain-containing protein n=1 Tax=Poritiphilus flavus TaxID=2697053 RepID=A0A6L9ED44_9FLAO|nr:zinc-binding alcohol dehydrogenase family protein [Poritiphilus flavus]NAS12309.1 alcohol dehydrogenase catalytic domain-containing protein [Poritiphilus flavus]
MKYIVCQTPGSFLLKEKSPPSRKKGEALLKIVKVGICGTDLHAFSGNQAFFTYPRILGHELSAEILEIDENDKGIIAGDKVVIMPYVSCGKCIACRSGKPNCCQELKVLGIHTDGGMQEQFCVSVDLLIKATDLSHDEIAIVEPLAIGMHALGRAQIQPGENLVVMGCGPIGLGILKLAQLSGANVIALDISKDRLRYAKEVFGIKHTVLADSGAREKIAELTTNNMATAVFDATGNKKALESGIDYMAHGGRYILVGLSKESLSFHHPAIHAKETTLLCSRNATMEDFRQVIQVLRSGQFPTAAFVTHNIDFTSMINVFESWLDPKAGVIKAMVNF